MADPGEKSAAAFPTDVQSWDLERFFEGGAQSESYQSFVDEVAEQIETLVDRAGSLPALADVEPEADEWLDAWVGFLDQQQTVGERFHQAMSFARCIASANTNDPKAVSLPGRLQELSSRFDQVGVDLEANFRGVDDEVFARLVGHPELQDLTLFLEELRRDAEMSMSPELEGLAAELNRDGLHAWGDLYDRISGQLNVEMSGIDAEEGADAMSVGQAKNLLTKPERDVRREAYEGLQETWRGESATFASILNAIIGSQQTLYDRRGLDELTEPLQSNRIERETLEAMLQAADEIRGDLLDYVDLKGRALGVDQIEWYDLRAPVGSDDSELDYRDAQAFIADQVDDFSSEMGAFYRNAMADQWVEAEDRPGKAQGGFCITFPMSSEQRIFMTYGGSMSSVLTLAHELGHAYHGWVMRDLPPAARHVPMTLAESASTLSEKLVESAAFERAGEDEKLHLLDERLQRALTFLVDIPARFRLERKMHEARRAGQLSPRGLTQMTESVYEQAFDGRVGSLDSYFWASKLHYYITRQPFYNFPYLFGYLFSKALYQRVRQLGPEFAGVVDDLLVDSGRHRAEELAEMYLDADITNPAFWLEAAGSLREDVATYRGLVEG